MENKISWVTTVYITGQVGVLCGSIFWPVIVKYISKKMCLTISVVMSCITMGCSGVGNSIYVFSLCQFGGSLFMNIFTVGKDFIFDYFVEEMRQTAMTLCQIFNILGMMTGPLIGVVAYRHCQEDFELAAVYIMIGFIFVLIIELITFYAIPFHPIGEKVIDLEERMRLITRNSGEQIYDSNLKQAFLKVMNRPSMRNVIIIYVLSTGCTNADLLVCVFFMLTPYDQGGFGISPSTLSFVYFVSAVPCLLLLVVNNKFVPNSISYKNAIFTLILIYTICVVMTPLYREIINMQNYSHVIPFVLVNQALKAMTSSHSFSPFLHFMYNKKLNKHIRTGLNSLNYMFNVIWSIIFVKFCTYLYTKMMVTPYFVGYAPYNKYVVFVIIAIMQIVTLFLLSSVDKKHLNSEFKGKPGPSSAVVHRKGSDVIDDKQSNKKPKNEFYYGHVTFKNQEKDGKNKQDPHESPF